MSGVPNSRPQQKRADTEKAALRAWKRAGNTGPLPAFYVYAKPAYYSNTFAPAGNNRGVYDDAVFVVSPNTYSTFNANTDPSVFRKNIATLKPGVHKFMRGNHGISRPGGGYPAFRPATKNEELPVTRDGVAVPWPGVAINIHRGGRNTTSSEGCQTIPPAQWDAFYALVDSEMRRAGVKEFHYILDEA